MSTADQYDAVIVGAGPNGLAAAITLARAGRSVLVIEAYDRVGGGIRSAELTLPGFVHDVCSAIHPLGVGSPFFRTLPLADYGLAWVHPPAPVAHPLWKGVSVMAERSVEATAERLGRDAAAYRRLMEPLVRRWDDLGAMILGPLLRVPRHPVLLARFGLPALLPATRLARTLFHDDRTHALFAGMAAHSMLPLDGWISASFGLVLSTLAHAVGWPMVRGGTQALADALAAYLRALGGEIRTGHTVRTLDELPPSRAVLLDLTPRQVLQIAGDRLPAGYRQALNRYRYGPGVFKIDFALSSPIPWQTPDTARAATVHLGGTLPEIAAAERAVWQGKHPERPYVIVVQQSLFDPTRAPAGQHTAWAYCHVPNGSTCDLSGVIEAQIERAAPGFRDTVLARHTLSPAAFEAYNANYVGGDINGGVQDLAQLVMRPTLRLNPYTTPVRGLYLCSSSTPPGGGVHGMSGHLAARTALRRMF